MCRLFNWLLGLVIVKPPLNVRLREYLTSQPFGSGQVCEVSDRDYDALLAYLKRTRDFIPFHRRGGVLWHGFTVRPNASLRDGNWRVR